MKTYLLSYCPDDAAGANIADNLLSILKNEGTATEQHSETGFGPLFTLGDHYLLKTRKQHIYLNGLHPGVGVDGILFMSRHSSESGKRCLTVHAMGNYLDAHEDHGGETATLSPPLPLEEGALLRTMAANVESSGLEIPATLEATHHGPAIDTPSLNIEIGSTMDAWTVPEYGRAVALAIHSVIFKNGPGRLPGNEREEEEAPGFLGGGIGGERMKGIGIGGGHYAPRFTDVALHCNLTFGHIIPTYIFDACGEERAEEVIGMAAEGTDGAEYAYFDRKSLKGGRYGRYKEMAENMGLKAVRMKHLNCQD